MSEYKKSVIVLRKKLDELEAKKILEDKKTDPFKTLLTKPNKADVSISSFALIYEAMVMVEGNYSANYYRKATHSIKVDYNVSEVVLGDGIFPIREKSGWRKILGTKKGKNTVDLELEEHVFVDDDYTRFFNHLGDEVDFEFSYDPKIIENYPDRMLQEKEHTVKRPRLTEQEVIKKFESCIKRPKEKKIRDLDEKVTIRKVTEIYVPIFEARLVGPKSKVDLLRIDASRNKLL